MGGTLRVRFSLLEHVIWYGSFSILLYKDVDYAKDLGIVITTKDLDYTGEIREEF